MPEATLEPIRFLMQVEKYAEGRGLQLSEGQRAAVNLFMKPDGVSIITGGPGTGKSEIVRVVLGTLMQMGEIQHSPVVLATTARSAAGLGMVAGLDKPITVHRWLGFNGKEYLRQHEDKFVLVEESSMLDTFLLERVLKWTGKHLILMGDHNQLPPIGAGYPLRDMVLSEKFDTVVLDKVFRQDKGSSIALAANAMITGKKNILEFEDDNLQFIDIRDDEKALEWIRDRVTPANWQVLTPMHRGDLGTTSLNTAIQSRFLHGIQELPVRIAFNTPVRINDKVICKKNHYDKKIHNGDQGNIRRYDKDLKSLVIDFDSEHDVHFHGSDLKDLQLAYAVTVHSMQGSEAPNVIVALSHAHSFMWNRALLYTAITRAKKKCMVVGSIDMLSKAIKNMRGVQRNTFLREDLEQL